MNPSLTIPLCIATIVNTNNTLERGKGLSTIFVYFDSSNFMLTLRRKYSYYACRAGLKTAVRMLKLQPVKDGEERHISNFYRYPDATVEDLDRVTSHLRDLEFLPNITVWMARDGDVQYIEGQHIEEGEATV